MNHSTVAVAALTLLAGLGCSSDEVPSRSLSISDTTDLQALTFSVSGMR